MSRNTTNDNCQACDEYRRLSRREFMARGTATAVALSVPAWLPRVTYAQSASSSDVLISIFLRGGADGLSLVPPFGDPSYYALRPTLAIPPPGSAANPALNLDGFFGLPPAMAALLPVYQGGQLLIVHASGSTDPSRSHFDAQFFMEIGKPGDLNVVTGWLGRHLASRPPAKVDAALRGIGFNYGLPQTLVGAPDTLPIPDPANFGLSGNSSTRTQRLTWLGNAYQVERDPLKTAALNTQRTITTLSTLNINGYVPAGGAVYPGGSFGTALRSTAALIRADMGVEAVQIDLGGWDTHSQQGPINGGMAVNMQQFAQAIAAFYVDMVYANKINNVTLVADLRVRPGGARKRQPGHRPRTWQRDVRHGRPGAGRPSPDPMARPRGWTALPEPGPPGDDRLPRHPRRDRAATPRQHQPRSGVPGLHADDAGRVPLGTGIGIRGPGKGTGQHRPRVAAFTFRWKVSSSRLRVFYRGRGTLARRRHQHRDGRVEDDDDHEPSHRVEV